MPLQLILLVPIVGILACTFIWYTAKPKPIPGIPYNPASADRLLGDIPDSLAHLAETSELWSFFEQRCRELGSPIIQVFMRPFSKPWVILVDCRESHDIMTQRGREFDRSGFMKKMFAPIFPKNQICMPTHDQWRYNRLLMRELMSPPFLDGVAAPLIHSTTLDLISVWRHKARLARGHAFEASRDVQFATLDTICSVAFGARVGITTSQEDNLNKLTQLDLPDSLDHVASIPETTLPEAWGALLATVTSGEIAMNSPLGSWHLAFAIKFYPRLRRAFAFRNKLINDGLHHARQRVSHTNPQDEEVPEVKCAAEWVVERASKLAEKDGEGKKNLPDHQVLFDELAGFLQAGFDTTSSTIHWGLKYLTGYQNVQQKLRTSLLDAFCEARQAGRQPTAKEICKTSIPYLDAFIEESLRHSCVISVNMRVAIRDADVLGYVVPRGTDVYMLTNGPSILRPAMPIDENKRSHSSREYKSSADSWNSENLDQYNPDRWLIEEEEGENGGKVVKFNSRAAPMQNFGSGVRACYGKKLAYQNLRIIYVLIVWNFILDPLPEALEEWKATDGMTHLPQHVRLILREV
ncbi:cytochrome P450 [Sphaerulina musiva SO2202]|uniref:Cytochrome P450 n=1 Tax=Sphaerulina musiva (strain SO2202) TaxID=692275 RepID=M3D786_SPHMS|nr:cytochrome P450 [Sphaerulina musiva SO2202]EMF14025.1 cytochrome P450 [Sphaerulina musiva SO2202]